MISDLPGRMCAVDRCNRYAKQVLDGDIIACEKVKKACARYLKDLKRQRDDDFPWRFDVEKANRPVDFIEKFLKPTKGDYTRMELLDWQCFCQSNIYGWVDKKTGLRRFNEALIIIGRGNGKSTLMSGNAAYGACKDGEPGADIYLLANSKEQAGIIFNECRAQIQSSPALRRRFRPLRDGIYYDAGFASIRHRASDSRKLDGLNPHMGIYDEIHEYRDFKLINVIKRAAKKRRQPLMMYITTMGNVLDGVLSTFYGLFSDALEDGVLDPSVSDRMFAFIAEMDSGDDLNDSSLWIKANPSMDKLFTLKSLQDDWARSSLVPSERADFICKQLNVTVDTSDAAYIGIETLNKNDDVVASDTLLDCYCYGGFDLSSREDFTSACLLFTLDDGRDVVLSHSWTTKQKADANNEKIPYARWAMLGDLTICDTDYIPQELVFEWFKAMGKKYRIQSIGYDPANAMWLVRSLEAEGFPCEVVRQGPITLNDPMKDLREHFLDGRVVLNQNAMLRWYIHNVRLRNDYMDRDKENWMPTKRNRYRKIDGFMAMLDAWCVRMRVEPIYGEQSPEFTIYNLNG